MKTIMFVFGTRPEAIKMAPIIKLAQRNKRVVRVITCVTGQHKNLLSQMLDVFNIKPDYDLKVMKSNQSLFYSTARILTSMEKVLKTVKPDIVLVQGDTTTAFIASLAAFYLGIKVGHVEAGLRTYDKSQPFPEEMNRRCADALADFYFAPTKRARHNLMNEGIKEDKIVITGNTIVDAINMIMPTLKKIDIHKIVPSLNLSKRMILVTAHRRENFNGGIRNICLAIKDLNRRNKNIEFVFPVHPNPNVVNVTRQVFSGCGSQIHLIEPIDYFSFLKLLNHADLVLSDSGGVQEEAPSFKKPVLILRNVTERPEILECGLGRLVGTNRRKIVEEAEKFINAKNQMRCINNPFGDGLASHRIMKTIINA